MNFKAMLWSILIFSMIIVAVGVGVDTWSDKYNTGITSDFDDLNKRNEIIGTAETQKGSLNPQSGEASSDFETETFRGGYGIITNIFSSLRVIFGEDGMIDSIGERFGIPFYVIGTIIAMFIIAITFAIVAVVFRLGRGSA